MPESTRIKTKRHGQIVVHDLGAAHSYTQTCEVGDFSGDVPRETINLYLDRGSMSGCGGVPQIRLGDDQPCTFGWSAYMRDLGDTAGAYDTLMDLLFRYTGGTFDSVWVSTLGTDSDVKTVTVTYTVDGAAFGEADKTLTYEYSVLRGGFAEGDPSTITASGTSYTVAPALS